MSVLDRLVPEPEPRGHVDDKTAEEFHGKPYGDWQRDHVHIILEDWSPVRKNRLADHIDQCHTFVSVSEKGTP